MKNISRFYLILLFCLACNTSKKEISDDLRIITVKEKDVQSVETKLSGIVKKIEIIPLATSKESLIGMVGKVVETENGFLIFDRPGSEKIFEFDKSGNFIKTIGSTGNAPHEYISAADFEYDEKVGELYILDNGRRLSIKKYDLKSGKHLGDLFFKDAYGYQFSKLVNGNWAVAGITESEPFAFFSTDSDFKNVIAKDIPIKPYFDAVPVPQMFTKSAGLTFFRVGVRDTLYQIKDGKLSPYLYVDFEKKVNEEQYEKTASQLAPQDIMTLPLKVDGMHDVFNFLENNDFVYFTFLYRGQMNFSFVNRASGKKIIVPAKLMINDFIGIKSDNLNMFAKSYDERSFMGIVEPANIDKSKLSSKLLGKEVYDTLMNLPEDANQIIIKYYITL